MRQPSSRFALAFAAGLVLCGRAFAAVGAGTTGADFLRIPVGPRQAAMGDQGASLSDDGFSAYYNPAAIAQLQNKEFDLMYNQWVEGVSQQYLAYVHPDVAGGSLGLGMSVLRVDSFQGYDASGVSAGPVGSQDLAPSLTYARHLWGSRGSEAAGLSAGLSAQYIHESLENESASGYAGDAGLLAHFPFKDAAMQAGFAATHIGSGLSYYGRRPPLPETYALGLSGTTKRWGAPLTLSVEGRKTIYLTPSVSVGGEYWITPLLALRLGYKSADDLGPGVRAGIGVRIKDVQFDYAMSIMGDYGWTHRVGLSYRFGKPSGIERARRLMDQKRYAEALLEINRVLEDNPKNAPALDLLNELQKIMKEIEAHPAS